MYSLSTVFASARAAGCFGVLALCLASACFARPARLYPALAIETPGSAAEVERIVAQERARLDRAESGGGQTLEEILQQLEVAEGRAGESRTPMVTEPPEPPPLPAPTLVQQLRAGYYNSTLEAAQVTIPTTEDIFSQYTIDYRHQLDPVSEIDITNLLHAGTLKSENFFDGYYIWTPDPRLRTRFRQHFEVQKNAASRLVNDYDLNASELTVDYNFPVRLRALARGFIENRSFDRETAFNFNGRAKTTEFYLERPFMNGTYSADLINEGQYFDSDPLSNFQRQTLNFSGRGPLTRRIDAEARFVRERQDRNVPDRALDYDDNLWIFLVDWRAHAKTIVRLERDLENKVFVVPDEINFSYRRVVWRPSVTWLPSTRLSLIADLVLQERRHRELDPNDLILESDEDYDTTIASLTATYTGERLFVTTTLARGSNDHVLPDNVLQADYDSTELSGSATYNFSTSKSMSLTYSRIEDDFVAIADANDSKSEIVTGDFTYRF